MALLRHLRGFIRLPRARRPLLLEAAFGLLAARLMLRFVPFRYLTLFMKYPLADIRPSEFERGLIRNDVSRAIREAAAHLPGNTVCFPRALAAQVMCRRRGIDARLFYGASTANGTGLTAHVWVQDGSAGVVGCEEMSQFRTLARFPA